MATVFFIQSAHGQGVTAVPDIVPPSPTAASLGQYGEVPVSLANGTPSINIPLWASKGKVLSMPISLSYHASGVRVEELPGWAGLGWSLNAGGVITRTMRGIPDEFPGKGYFNHDDEFLASTETSLDDDGTHFLIGDADALAYSASQGIRDIEPDIFVFNFMGRSGKIVFDKTTEGVQPYVMPHSDLKIESPFSGGNTWVITDESGTRYVFGATLDGTRSDGGETTFVENICFAGDNQSIIEYASSWYLVEILPPNGNDDIQLYYSSPGGLQYDLRTSETTYQLITNVVSNTANSVCEISGPFNLFCSYHSSCCAICEQKQPSVCLNETTVAEVVLDRITTTYEEVKFLTVARTDTKAGGVALDEMEVRNRATGQLLKKFRFDMDYFESGIFAPLPTGSSTPDYLKKRLRLDGVYEVSTGGTELPPHSFEYHTEELPPRNSFAQDHWGYYNGQNGNENLSPNQPFLFFDEGGDREPSEEYMKAGILTKVTYPTGGHIEMEFGAHRYRKYFDFSETQKKDVLKDSITTCYRDSTIFHEIELEGTNWQDGFDIVLTDTVLANFSMIVHWSQNGNCGEEPSDFNFEITGPVIQNNVEYTGWSWHPIVNSNGAASVTDMLVLLPGTHHISGQGLTACGDGWLGLEYVLKVPYPCTEAMVGGLRIEKLTVHDGISGENDIVKEYVYETGYGLCSGVLQSTPKYTYISTFEQNGIACSFITRTGMNQSPMSTSSGSHMEYTDVIVRHGVAGSNGSVHSEFTTALEHPDTRFSIWPFPPPTSYNWRRGLLKRERTYDSSGGLKSETTHSYSFRPENYHEIEATVLSTTLHSNLPAQNNVFLLTRYKHVVEWFTKDNTKETIYDGQSVTKYTEYEYEPNHLNLVKSSFTNSDGKVHTTKLIYPTGVNWGMDQDESAAVTEMIDRHMTGVPLREERYVKNGAGTGLGTQVKGSWAKYGLFTGVSEDMVLPAEFYGYWEGWQTGDPDTEIEEYTLDGLPKKIKKRGWQVEEYTWQDGRVIQKDWGDWSWGWDWYFDTHRKLKSQTDIDGQTVHYDYDSFLRLEGTSARDGNVTTEIDYFFGQPDEWQGGNHVRTRIDYSDFDDQETYAYFDGLGRPLDTWRMGYGPGTEDVVSERIYYDDQGRVEKSVYIPDIQNGLSYTEFFYEDSPLNRKEKETYPDGNSVTTDYGGEGNHYLTTVTDENGNSSVSKTDILGRQVQIIDAMGGVTGYVYDDRDNLLSVTNPGSEVYSYTYDDRNRMIGKVVPGQSTATQQGAALCNLYLYDDRGLLTASQDPNQKAAGKWLGNIYDEYGQVLTTGFGTPQNGATLDCGTVLTVDTDFTITVGEEMIVNDYYALGVPNGTGTGCSSTYTPIGKLKSTTATVLYPDGTYGSGLQTRYCYDEYGRVAFTESDNLQGGLDTWTSTYDIADHLGANVRDHENGKLTMNEAYTYDHGGRMVDYQAFSGSNFYIDNVSFAPNPTYGAGGGAGLKYNTKDQLEVKTVGGAKLNYFYNDRGWLTDINKMHLDHVPFVNTPCDETPPGPVPPQDPSDFGPSCASCPKGALTLPQILRLRFNGNLNVDCYQDCGCTADCDPERIMPCPDSAYVAQNGDTILVVGELSFPTDLYHILECTGKERWLQQEDLNHVSNRYAIMGRYPVESSDQLFRVGLNGQDTIVDLSGMLALAQDDNAGDVTVKSDGGGKDGGCGGCSSDPPPCSPADSLAQESALSSIGANLHDPVGLAYPTYIKRVRLCSGLEVYLFEEELNTLQAGTFTVLQTIGVQSDLDELVVASNGLTTTYSVTLFLCVRDLLPGWEINYYKPCEDNECGVVGKVFDANSVGATTIFSDHDGAAPYRDLVATSTGEGNSIGHDQVVWSIGVYPTVRPPGEAEWDMGVPLPPDAELQTYKVYAIIPEVLYAPVRIGLHDGNGFVKVNGGQDFVSINGTPYPQQPFVELKPDQLPSSSQVEDMKVAIYVGLETGVNADLRYASVDAVYATVDYTEPCDRCDQEELDCTPEEQQAQMQALQDIEQAFENTPMDEIPMPTKLYRVRLCNGDEVYLLHHELDLMPPPYQILQVVGGVNNFTQTFNGDILTSSPIGPGPTPPDNSRDDIFALKLDYYQGSNQQELFNGNGFPTSEATGYNNGNIARMTWQVAGRDRQVYGFTYDELDRLTKAAYADQMGPKGFEQFYNYGLYKVTGMDPGGIGYDAVGNITSLQRGGVQTDCEDGFDYGTIDRLRYTYSGSRLQSVQDLSGEDAGFNARGGTLAHAYMYDDNGNMTGDQSKALAATYSHLNLPLTANTDLGAIEWIYDASGRKLSKRVTGCDEEDCVTITYVDGIEYHMANVIINGTLLLKEEVHINHTEGRASYYTVPDDPTKNYWQGEHYIKDHLGNVRLTIADKNHDGYIQVVDGDPVIGNTPTPPPGYTEILQENHYYPFGMLMGGPWRVPQGMDNVNRYGYNGKELDLDIGLDWNHYGARMYLAEIGRWNAVDPLADDYFPVSTYNYVINNPIKFIDPDGMRVDVSDLVNGGTNSDMKILLQLMANLSEISGSVIQVKTDDKGKSTLTDAGCNDDCGSRDADGYISFLLNDDSGEVRVYNNERNTRKNPRTGENNKNAGSQAYASGDIYLDEKQIDNFMNSLDNAGVDSRTLNYGMVFLHETLHTRYGASYYRNDGGRYVDPRPGFESTHKAGDTVDKVNVFRRELGLPERGSYGGHNPATIRFNIGGKPTDIPIIYK